MNTSNTTPQKSASLDLLRQLAFMQYNDEIFFFCDGKFYEGSEYEAQQEYDNYKTPLQMEGKDDIQSFAEYVEDNYTEISDFDNDNYMVLTDEEADEKCAEYIKDSIWAFNADFIACHCSADIDEEMIRMWQEKCEGANDGLTRLIDDLEEFISDAVAADGRGHFMSSYDGCENEETIKGIENEDTGEESTTFYIYRLN